MGLQIAAAIFLPFIAYGLWAALRGRNRGGVAYQLADLGLVEPVRRCRASNVRRSSFGSWL